MALSTLLRLSRWSQIVGAKYSPFAVKLGGEPSVRQVMASGTDSLVTEAQRVPSIIETPKVIVHTTNNASNSSTLPHYVSLNSSWNILVRIP